MATLTTLVSFNQTNGSSPYGTLLVDASGNLFGTTHNGGTSGAGTIFELARAGGGYAGSTTVLASLQSSSGAYPFGNVIMDAAGDLITATSSGTGAGSILQLSKTASGYAAAPVVLASTTAAQGSPVTNLVADTAGNLYGTGSGGGFGTQTGTVYTLSRSGTGYTGTPTTLGSFNSAQGAYLGEGVVLDAAGNIFGVTSGSNSNVGSVFEIARTATGYAASVTLATITGALVNGPLAIDAAGNLYGTTETGGTAGRGTVFELARTANAYASATTTLASFAGGAKGDNPLAGVLVDAAGNVFGTTSTTVFEIAKTASGYAAAPVTLVSFSGANGSSVYGGLAADASGNLFGTTSTGGANGLGTVFELTGTGFMAGQPRIAGTVANQSVTARTPLAPFSGVTVTDAALPVQTLTVTFAAANGALNNLGNGSYDAAAGTYTDTGTSAALTSDLRNLVFTPATGNGSVTTAFTITDRDTAGGIVSDAATTVTSINPTTVGAAVFRFYNPADEGHFFTSSLSEVDQIKAGTSGLVLEGPAFNAVNPLNNPAAATVYRFYQPANNSHFYTDSYQEVLQVQATRPDMTLEGPAFSVDATMQAGDIAVYRYYETRSDTHLYTSNAAEMSTISSTRPDLLLEGPAFYIPRT